MEEKNEDLDSSNQEENETSEENDETQEGEPDLDALQKEKEELSDKNRKLFERAKKAETEAKELRDKLKVGEKPEIPESQSNEPDYARLAFLETKGVNHPDDQKVVQDEAMRLKLPLTDVLGMEHIQAKLKDAKDQREALEGAPKGKGRASSKTQSDVDYWLNKKKPDGTFETPEDVELAGKVIEARIKKEEKANQFSDELYTG